MNGEGVLLGTLGSSAFSLAALIVSRIRCRTVQDDDGTTDVVRGELIAGGSSVAMYFYDDGTNGDSVEGDGIWTSRFSWLVPGGSGARVESFSAESDARSSASA